MIWELAWKATGDVELTETQHFAVCEIADCAIVVESSGKHKNAEHFVRWASSRVVADTYDLMSSCIKRAMYTIPDQIVADSILDCLPYNAE